MAERRMFTKKITDSDAFIELSSSAQALYFHLNQGADDDGFNNQIQNAMFKSHATIDDLKVLMCKNFIIRFESGVIVIKHWRMHNTLRKDRYTPTNFQEELAQLGLKENGAYTLGCQVVAERLPDGCRSIGKYSIGKDSIDKSSSACTDTSVTAEKTIITLDLVGNDTFSLLESDYNKLVSIYVGVDVMGELRKMKGWLFSHPQNRKTRRGIMRFITNWLSREQDTAKTKRPVKIEEEIEDDWLS